MAVRDGIAVFQWNVGNEAACARCVEAVEAQMGPIDVLVKQARQHVSVGVVRNIEGVDRLRGVLASAKGIFIVPSHGRAAIGTGILPVHRPYGQWSDPVFYNRGLNVGLQAGAEGGNLALVPNNDKAVNVFLKRIISR